MITASTLGQDLERDQPVELPAGARGLGLYVIGNMGMGKSTLLENLILQDIEHGLGLCLLDPHGDLVESVLARLPATRENDVVLLDLLDVEHPFGLNLFACANPTDPVLLNRTVAGAVQAFKKIWGPGTRESSWGPQMEDLLRNCAVTLATTPGMTLAELPRLLTDQTFRMRLVARLSDGDVRAFWRDEYDRLRPADQLEHRLSTMNKVRAFLANPIARPIVGQSRSSLDARRAMDTGQIVLVKLASDYEDLSNLVGTQFVGQVLMAALSRADMEPAARRPFMLYADEFQRFATLDFRTLLSEARKYAVVSTVAHQYRGQLDHENREATLAVRNLVVFAVSGPDAQELAHQFDTTPRQLRVIGQRPIMSIAQDPVKRLLRDGRHHDQRVAEFVRLYLGPFADAYDRLPPGGHLEMPIPNAHWSRITHYRAHRESLQEGLQLINRFFVDLMEGRYRPGDYAAVPLLSQVIETLRAYLQFAEECDFVDDLLYGALLHLRLSVPGWLHRAIGTYVGAGVHYSASAEGKHPPLLSDGDLRDVVASEPASLVLGGGEVSEAAFGVLVAARVTSLKTWMKRSYFRQYYLNPSSAPLPNELTWERLVEQLTQLARRECAQVHQFLQSLRACAEALSIAPILAPSSVAEPIFDEQSHQERLNELANLLSTLPTHAARCRLEVNGQITEHVFRPIYRPAGEDSQAGVALRRRVRERSRSLYAMPRRQAEAAIHDRQADILAEPLSPVGLVTPIHRPRTQRRATLEVSPNGRD